MKWIVSHDVLKFIYSSDQYPFWSPRRGDKADGTPVFDIHFALVPGTIQHGFDSSTAGTDTPIPSLYCTRTYSCAQSGKATT